MATASIRSRHSTASMSVDHGITESTSQLEATEERSNIPADTHSLLSSTSTCVEDGDVTKPTKDKSTQDSYDGPAGSVLAILEPYIVKQAFSGSTKQETAHTPTCRPDTQARVLQEIEGWLGNNTQQTVCWLHGARGAGKTSIARTVIESHRGGQLAAFIVGKEFTLDQYQRLTSTLAYQLADTTPASRPYMQEYLAENGTPLKHNIDIQFRRLIIEPLKNLDSPDKPLVVVDGLDEPAARKIVLELIKLLGKLSAYGEHPLRFLLTCRAEPHIDQAFRGYMTANNFVAIALEDSRDEICKYIRQHLLTVRKEHDSEMPNEPIDWPPNKDIDVLMRNSDGLFLYATTVVRYIGDGREPPQDKLRKVVRMEQGIDALYYQVVSEAELFKDFHRIISILMFLRYPLPIIELARFLRMDISNLRSALAPCLSVLIIPEDDLGSIRPYHASFWEFLMDGSRSRDLFCDPAQSHAAIAIQCLQAVTDSLGTSTAPPEYAGVAWYAHCAYLLSATKKSREATGSFCRDVELAMKVINPEWLKHWVKETLPWAGVGYIKVDMSSSKGMPPEAKSLHIKLKRIARVLTVWCDLLTNMHG